MPGDNGWHLPFVAAGRYMAWHYCAHADEDTLVEWGQRENHERECRAAAKAAERARQKAAEKRRLAGLKAYHREQRLRRGGAHATG